MKQVIGAVVMMFVFNPVARGPPVHFADPDLKAEVLVSSVLFREIPDPIGRLEVSPALGGRDDYRCSADPGR